MLLIAAAVALLVDGSIPFWVGVLVLAREVVVSVVVLALTAAGGPPHRRAVGREGGHTRPDVRAPVLLAARFHASTGHDLLFLVTWGFTIGGLVLSYYAAALYVPLAAPREALRDGRQARD